MSKLFQYNVRCILIFLIISITYTPVYSSPAIQLEKEVVIDSPSIGTANLPDKMTFRLYDSGTAAAPIASQSFNRGGYSAYYNIAKSDGLTQKSIVRLSVEFTDLSQLGSNIDALNNLWLEVELDGRSAGEREPLNKEATKQILSLAAAQYTVGPDTSQNVTKQVSGSDGQIQYNNGGVEGGASQFYYDDVNHRVGIGTAAPGANLQVTSGGATRIAVNNSNAGAFSLSIQGGPGVSRLAIGTDGGSLGVTERIAVMAEGSNAGNVGIGTINPGANLQVTSGGATKIAVNNSNAGAFSLSIQGGPGVSRLAIGTDGGSLGVTERIAVMAEGANAGNVGIGTINPCADCKLAVNGKIRAKSVVVDTGWSDIVFEDKYKLMPLRELERFIKENRHLPGIPAEADVKENGISVGDISAKLLQKIEELTLYVIELKKENEALQKQLGNRTD